MTFENAIATIESALAPEQLTELQKAILHHVWKGESYLKMSFALQYNHGYLKDVGAGLWRLLSNALGENVKKHNLRTAIARYQHKRLHQPQASYSEPSLALSQWMAQEQHPVVAVFDIGQLARTRDRGSQNEPVFQPGSISETLLQDMLQSLDPKLSLVPPDQPEVLMAQMLEVLRQRRCLLVLAA